MLFMMFLIHFLKFAANNTWEQLHPTGDTLQNLQEHTAVVYQDKVYVFGGEVGFSSASESPLWSYSIKVLHIILKEKTFLKIK